MGEKWWQIPSLKERGRNNPERLYELEKTRPNAVYDPVETIPRLLPEELSPVEKLRYHLQWGLEDLLMPPPPTSSISLLAKSPTPPSAAGPAAIPKLSKEQALELLKEMEKGTPLEQRMAELLKEADPEGGIPPAGGNPWPQR